MGGYMGYEYFASVMTPAIALLILSTTMRLGNVRMALTELAKIPNVDLESLDGYQLFKSRASFLCRGLRLLNIALLVLLPSALGRLLLNDPDSMLTLVFVGLDVLFFLVLFSAVFFLFKESQLTGRSIIAHTREIQSFNGKN